jgi:hypothetical protein
MPPRQTTPPSEDEHHESKHHIYDERFRSMATRMDGFDESFKSLKAEMKDGFNSIFTALDRRSHEPMRFGKEFFSLLALGVGALWFVITLLVNPVAKNQEMQGQALYSAKTYLEAQIPLLSYKADANREMIDRNAEALRELRARELAAAQWKGEVNAKLEWLRDDTEAGKEDLRVHEAMPSHPNFQPATPAP